MHVSVKNKWNDVLKTNEKKNRNQLLQEKCKDLQTLSNVSIKNTKMNCNVHVMSGQLEHVSVKHKRKEITSDRHSSSKKAIKKTWDSEEDFQAYALEIASTKEKIETIENKVEQDFNEKETFDVKDDENDDDNKTPLENTNNVIEIESDIKETISNVKVTINPSDVYQFVKENSTDSILVDASHDVDDVDDTDGMLEGINSNTKSDSRHFAHYRHLLHYDVADVSVIMDNGSSMTRAGYVNRNEDENDTNRRKVFPTVIGGIKSDSMMNSNYINSSLKQTFVGDEALRIPKRLSKKKHYPIEYGIVNDWDSMEKIWRYTFDSLSCDSSQNNVLLTEGIANPTKNREISTQIMFETFDTQCFYVIAQSTLRLYASGS